MTEATAGNARGAILAVEDRGRQRAFGADDLPVVFGSGSDADVVLEGVPGNIQISRFKDVFFVQAGRGARNVRVVGEPLKGTREIGDGDVIAFDRARLECRLEAGALAIRIDRVVTAGDTAPPDLDELARKRGGDDLAITPIAFKPAAAKAAGSRGPSRATIAVGAGFAVLATIVWFAFTAKSVALDIEPPPAEVGLPSTLFKLQVGDRILLRRGTHRVVAELPGYYPLDTEVEVGAAGDQTIALAMTKLPGLVTLTTDPEVGAQVIADGMPLGTTPLVDVELTPGMHQLEFTAERHVTATREIEVQGGGERQALATTLTPDWAIVSIRTAPLGATVLVDGQEVGVTPADVEIASGDHDVEVRLSGYNAWASKILVTANQPQELPEVRLTQADGRLEIASNPSEANVSVDGEFRGRTPLSLRISPGRAHRLTVTKPGHATVTRELSVAADSGRRLEIELEPQFGEVSVASRPPNAEVWIDGERRGSTPLTLELTAISHAIEIRLEGFAIERANVTAQPGFPQRLERELVPLDLTSGGGFAPLLRTRLGQELRLLPAGQFTMGSSRREAGRRPDEVLRPVRLTRAFYLGAREVTNAEFRAFRPSHDSGTVGGHSLNRDDQPVVNVTWDDAVQYLNWLSIQDGLQPVYEQRAGVWVPVRPLRTGYRLPTEAEWEWAARFAGQEAALLYPWGTDLPPPDRSGNYADVTAAGIVPTTLVTYNDGEPVTAAVGTYPANAYGIFDLGGNVSEWIQDFYVADAVDATQRVDDPLGPEAGRAHVVRGSNWRSATVAILRVSARASTVDPRPDIGFRMARNLQ
jgi:formylglycine-generating enzyme required for sulfatase activity